MLFRKCLAGVILSAVIVTASFALVANDASFGITEPATSGSTEAATDDTESVMTEHIELCPGRPDCNRNSVDDRCDVDCSNAGIFCIDGFPAIAGCDSGYFPSCGTSADCNDNNVPDECEGVECCNDGDCPRHQCCGQITPNTCTYCIE